MSSDFFDPAFPDRGVCLPFEQMTPEQFAAWREAYYDGLIVSPFGRDADGNERAPHGISIHGVPKLRPEDV